MQNSFFRIMRRMEKNKPVSKWHVEQFLYCWSSDFPTHLQFILSHYKEIKTILHHALSLLDTKPYRNSRTEFLLRNEQLSCCLNHFEQIVTPLYHQSDGRRVKTIQASNQMVLSRWDARTCLPDTASES